MGVSRSDGFGHIIIVTGYTDDNRFIVNDSYTNLMKPRKNWDYDTSGKGAIYDHENKTVVFERMLLYRSV